MLSLMTKPQLCGSSWKRCAAYRAALLALLAIPAFASPIAFDLSNVTFQGGITATGSITFDSATNSVTGSNVTAFGPSSGFFNFFAGGPVAFDTVEANFNFPSHLTLELLPPGGAVVGDLVLITDAGLSSTAPQTVNFVTSTLEINGPPLNDLQSLLTGSLVPESSGVPEPSTFVLLAAPLAFLMRRALRGK